MHTREVSMIGSTGSISAGMASLYGTNMRQLYDAMEKLASGKKFKNASEDLIGYLRAQNTQSDITQYEQTRENLTNFKASTSAAVVAGSSIYENLTEMKDLATQWAGTADADLKTQYAAEFNALKTEVSTTLANTYVDGVLLTDPGDATDATVSLGPDGGSLTLTFSDAADISSLDITAGTAVADTQAEVSAAMTYMYEAKSYDAITDQQIKLNDTIVNSKKAVLSLITDIDEAEQMDKVLSLTLRQQATTAMMAQANIVQNSLSKLYE
jgi:flagellin